MTGRGEFDRRRTAGLRLRHDAKLVRSATRDMSTMDTCADAHMSSKVEVVSVPRSTPTQFAHPDSTVRATMAREAARSIRRSQSVRTALASRALRPWLAMVDAKCPGLTDDERLRLAEIARRCLGSDADPSVRQT